MRCLLDDAARLIEHRLLLRARTTNRATLACDDTPRVAAAGMGISSEHALQNIAPVLVKKLAARRCSTQ
jgi:hypothetical protein